MLTCSPQAVEASHSPILLLERQAGKLWIPIFIVFGLIRPGIKSEATVSVADILCEVGVLPTITTFQW